MLLMFSVAAPMLALAQSKKSPTAEKKSAAESKAEAEVVGAIRGRMEAVAKKDATAWASFVADDCLSPMEGKGSFKQIESAHIRSLPAEVKSYYAAPEDINVRIHGDTAVVTYRTKEFVEHGGQATYARLGKLETYMRRGEKWLLVAVGATVFAPPAPPTAAKVDPGIYEAYVGQYEWFPTRLTRVSREGNKLIMRLPGAAPFELLPENETTFFPHDSTASRVVFVKDATGQVTHAIFRIFGWTDRIMKKIK